MTLYRRQKLPPPWSPVSAAAAPTPLIVYGASSALGCFVIKLAKASNIHPLIAIAGESNQYVKTLLDTSKGDKLIDHRNGVEKMQKDVLTALVALKAKHAVDCISVKGTWVPIAQLLERESGEGVMSVVASDRTYEGEEVPRGVRILCTDVGTVHEEAYRLGMPMQSVRGEEVRGDMEWVEGFVGYAGGMLERGEVSGHPYRVVRGGLEGGEARGRKFVYRVREG